MKLKTVPITTSEQLKELDTLEQMEVIQSTALLKLATIMSCECLKIGEIDF